MSVDDKIRRLMAYRHSGSEDKVRRLVNFESEDQSALRKLLEKEAEGELQAAYELSLQAVQLYPTKQVFPVIAARIGCALGEEEEAARLMSELNPESLPATCLPDASYVYGRLGMVEVSLSLMRKAAARDPSRSTLLRAGDHFYRHGWYDEAYRCYLEAGERSLDDALNEKISKSRRKCGR